MENKLPTAEEFLTNKYEFDLNSFQDNVEHLKEFAELHVEACKKEIQNKEKTFDFEGLESITKNVYPLTLIQ